MELIVDPGAGASIDATSTMYPSRLVVHATDVDVERPCSTTFGYVVDGTAAVHAPGFVASLEAGGYFAVPGSFRLQASTGRVVAIERVGFRGMTCAGRIEEVGRLTYIDGCSDSVLCMPPRLGDPVLNHLHFPAGTEQSLHAHPSIRLGVVARGSGLAHGRSGTWELALTRGAVFMIAANEVHAFRTFGDTMDVIAYHPDSDWGPTDAAHPMVNRTYLGKRGG